MPEEPSLPVSLTEPLVPDPARTIEADAVSRETPRASARRPACFPASTGPIPKCSASSPRWSSCCSAGSAPALGLPAAAGVLVLPRRLSRGRLARHDQRRAVAARRHGRRRPAHDSRRARRGLRQPRLRGRDAALPLLALEHAAGNGHRAKPLGHLRADEAPARDGALQARRGDRGGANRGTRRRRPRPGAAGREHPGRRHRGRGHEQREPGVDHGRIAAGREEAGRHALRRHAERAGRPRDARDQARDRIDPGQADRAGGKSAGPEGVHAAVPREGASNGTRSA